MTKVRPQTCQTSRKQTFHVQDPSISTEVVVGLLPGTAKHVINTEVGTHIVGGREPEKVKLISAGYNSCAIERCDGGGNSCSEAKFLESVTKTKKHVNVSTSSSSNSPDTKIIITTEITTTTTTSSLPSSPCQWATRRYINSSDGRNLQQITQKSPPQLWPSGFGCKRSIKSTTKKQCRYMVF